MKEGEVLKQLRKQIAEAAANYNLEEDELSTFLKAAISKLNGYVGPIMKKKLKARWGDCNWAVDIQQLSRPVLMKGRSIEEKNEILYIIKNISWTIGPSKIEVHRFLLNNFKKNLPSLSFSKDLYTRKIPKIASRCLLYYAPVAIDGRRMKPIQVYLTKNNNNNNVVGDNRKLNKSQLQQQEYSLEVKDRRLGNWKGTYENSTAIMIKNLSVEAVFIELQNILEDIYFITNDKSTPADRQRHAVLLSDYMIDPPSTTITNKPRGILELSKAERDAMKAEEEAAKEVEEAEAREKAEEEGEEGGGGGGPPETPLFGTDGPDVFDDASIPGEEPFVGEGGTPPTPEEMDHNFHNDEREDLTEEAERESGELEPAEGETREEAPEDAQCETEAEASILDSYNKEYSIDELMRRDGIYPLSEEKEREQDDDNILLTREPEISPSII